MQLLVKLCGAVILIISSSLIGYKKGEKYVVRAKILQEIILILRSVKQNIMYKKDTTAKALCEALKTNSLTYIKIELDENNCPEFPKVLKKSLNDVENQIEQYLNKQEINNFFETLYNLGAAWANEEVDNLNFSISFFESIAQKAKDEASIQLKLYKSLGIAAGAGLALLFL